MLLAELFVAQLDELIEKPRRENLGDLDTTCAQRIEKKEKLSHGRAHVERVEGLLERLELRQRGYELENVVLEIGLFEVAETSAVVQTQTDAGLMQPEFLGHIAEERVDRDATVRVRFVEFGKYRW